MIGTSVIKELRTLQNLSLCYREDRKQCAREIDLFNFLVETNFNDICRPHWTFFMFFSIVVKYRRWSIATSCWTNIHCILLGWKSQQTNDFIVSNNWSVYNASLRRANKEIRVDVKWKGPSLGGMIALNLFSANKPRNKSQASHIFRRIASNFRWIEQHRTFCLVNI